MSLRLYDTLSRTPQEVNTGNESVKIYCCGPTVYRDAHVGNLRTFLLADLVRRVLELTGNKVELVQNITDVGHMSEDFQEQDKMLLQASQEKTDPFLIARKYEEKFHRDLSRLNVIPADMYPRASESITLMHEIISKLLASNNAYVGTDNCVYFDSQSFNSYGAISGNRLESLKPGHRYEFVEQGSKKFHADWALWKSAGNRQEMIWDSPWGPGFPGWHIECSAMSLHYLGDRIDVHIGGIDLRFPHHENERAQSNVIVSKESVALWLHGEHLLFEGRKMSKSSENVVLLEDVIARGFDPLALRLCFLENRYRSQMDLTWAAIEAANSTLARWRNKIAQWKKSEMTSDEEFLRIIENDLDTPKVIQYLRAIEKNENDSDRAAIFLFADKVLGLNLDKQAAEKTLSQSQSDLLQLRDLARNEKRWSDSDELRKQLEASGLSISDTSDGQKWSWN